MRIPTLRSSALKSTTSLTLCLALVMPVPGPAMAQAKDRCVGLEIQLGEKPNNRKERRCLRQLRKAAKEAGQDVPELTEAELAAELEAEASDEASVQAEAEAAAAAEAAAQAEAEAAAAAEAAANAEAEAQAQAAAEAAAAEEAAAAAQAEADAAEARAAAEAEAAAVAEAEAQAAAEAAAQVEAEAAANAAAEAEAQAAAEAEADAQAAANAAAEAEAQAAAEAEAQAAAEAEAEAAADAEAQSEAEATADSSELEPNIETVEEAAGENGAMNGGSVEMETVEAGEANVDVTEEQQIEAEIEAAQDVDVISEGDAPAAAAAAEDDTEAEVMVETVSEEDTRSSTEDFDTSARGNEETTAQRRARDEGDSGLSDVEKVVLFGIGALAVGAILKNGAEVKSNSGDRVVVERDGQLYVLKDDDTLLRRPGSEVRTETFEDGSTRTTVLRPNGNRIVTIRTADGRVLRRTRILADGRRIALIDDTFEAEPVRIEDIPTRRADPVIVDTSDRRALRAALLAQDQRDFRRGYSLAQIRQIRAVRDLVAPIDLDAVNFETGSAAIRPSEARDLIQLGELMLDLIDENPGEVFLIEGHTDATGSAAFNLALSDRRAESVALALTEFFEVPPENMVIQGYGESNLKVRTLDSEPANRRAVVRRITPLLQTAELR